MRGVIVEANPALINELKRVRTQGVIVHAAITPETTSTVRLSVSNANELSSLDRGFVTRWQNGEVGEKAFIEVPALRINDLIEQEFSGGGGLLYLSIDIEGLDLDVLRDLDYSRFRPAIIQAEPSDHYLPNNSVHMIEYMPSVGYTLVCRTLVNLIFVDRRFLG